MPKSQFKTSKSWCPDPESSEKEFGTFWGTSSMTFRSHLSQVNNIEEDHTINGLSLSGREFVRVSSNQLTNNENSMSQGYLPDLCQKFPSGLFSPSKKLSNQMNETSEISGSVENNPFEDDVSPLELLFQSKFLPENLSFNKTKVSKNVLSDDVSLQCALCQEVFFQLRDLVVPRIEDENENQFQCEKCQTSPRQTYSPKRYFLLGNNEQANKCGEYQKTSALSSKLKRESSFSSEAIQNSFSQSSEFKENRQTHNEGKKLQCNLCQKYFSRSSYLNKHMLIHIDEKPYNCEFCTKRFLKSFDLIRHIRTHTGEKPFHCGLCQKSFAHSSSLKVHMQIHTREKLFECEICRKSISDSSHFKNHMLIHTNEKPYKCELCPKRFKAFSNLKRHLRTHTGEKPFECETCQKMFSNSTNLKVHMRTHTGEKPFQCEICKKSFYHSGHLNEHMRTHTGEKPFSCETCQKSFTQSSGLRKHMQTHTRAKPSILM